MLMNSLLVWRKNLKGLHKGNKNSFVDKGLLGSIIVKRKMMKRRNNIKINSQRKRALVMNHGYH